MKSMARIEKEIADLKHRLDALYHDDTTGHTATGPYFTRVRQVRQNLNAAYREQALIEAAKP